MFMFSVLDILKTALQTKAFLKNQSVYVLGKISSLQILALHNWKASYFSSLFFSSKNKNKSPYNRYFFVAWLFKKE